MGFGSKRVTQGNDKMIHATKSQAWVTILAIVSMILLSGVLASCCGQTSAPPEQTAAQSELSATPPAPPTNSTNGWPVVAIVTRPLVNTGDKAADEAANQRAINEMVAEAIALSGGLTDLVKDGQTVLIKPNMTNHRGGQYYPGMTTDVRVTAALVDALQKTADTTLIVADGCGPPAADMFRIGGYDKFAEKHGITLLDFATEKTVDVPIANPLADKSYALPKVFMDADVVINVPCIKTHQITAVTVSLKNYFGLMPNPRDRWHGNIERVLPDIARARPTALVVVDGLVGMEGEGPIDGTSVPMNIILAGRDMVAVDTVATMIMGFDPQRVPHIQLAAQQGVGVTNPDNIVIKGTSLAQVKREFAEPHFTVNLVCPKTDANIAKLLANPHKQPREGGWRAEDRGKVIGWECYFSNDDLGLDKARHPDVQPGGFIARFDKYGDSIRFAATYRSLYREDIEPIREALQAWIDTHMETQPPSTPPTTFPHMGEDIKAVREAMKK